MIKKFKAHRLFACICFITIFLFGCVDVDDGPQEEWHLKKILSGHHKSVESIEFSSDGDWVLSASIDNTARVWSAETGQTIQVIEGEGRRKESAKFSPDNSSVITAGSSVAEIWSVETGRKLLTLKGKGRDYSLRDTIRSAEFDPSGERVVTTRANPNLSARIWDLSKGQPILTLNENRLGRLSIGDFNTARFSPDGRRILTAGRTYTKQRNPNVLREWNSRSGRRKTNIGLGAERVHTAGYSENGKFIVAVHSGSAPTNLEDLRQAQEVTILDANTGNKLLSLEALHTGRINDAKFNREGSRLITASSDKTARIWDTSSGSMLALLEHPDTVNAAAFNPYGDCVATASRDNKVRIWCAASE